MTKIKNLSHLIEQEKLLYLEVEQLRSRLYLHDNSVVFGFFSAFYFAYQDIKKLFVKRSAVKSITDTKELSIASLKKKRRLLTMLSNTPYAWIIFLARKIKYNLSFRGSKYSLSFRGSQRPRNLASASERKTSTFLIFGSTSGDDLQSRSVQIAQKLSEKNKVIYIEGVFDEGSTPGFRIIEDLQNKKVIRLTARQSLHLNYQKPNTSEVAFLKKSLKTFLRSPGFNLYIHHPFWNTILNPKKGSFIFDRTDNIALVQNAAKHILLAEKKLVKNAAQITAPHKKLLRTNKDVILKNGVEWDFFKDTSKMIQTCDVGLCWIKKPVMGYIGTLDEKVDEVLIGKLAETFKTASIVLVGNTNYRPIIEVAEKYPNIFPVGVQPYKKLPLFLQSFDILITPFKSFQEGSAHHPELPLYLTSGKPVLATASIKKDNYVYYSKTHTDWMLAVAEALKEKKRSKKRYLRIAAAKKMRWNVNKLS